VSHTEDLKKLDRVIRDSEIRIRTLQTQIGVIEKELLNVVALQQVLEENVKCLKTNKIIAVANEYKKVKEELKRVKHRIETLNYDKTHFSGVLKEVESLLKKASADFEKMKNTGNENVLPLKPGKK